MHHLAPGLRPARHVHRLAVERGVDGDPAMIAVDPLLHYPNKPHGYPKWCHLFTTDDGDGGDLEQLHQFATRKLGLQRRWFQDDPPHLPHYDLTEQKRRLAIAQGAYALTWAQVKALIRARTETIVPDPAYGYCLVCKRTLEHHPPGTKVTCGRCLSELGSQLCFALVRAALGQAPIKPPEDDTTIKVGKRTATLWYPE